MNDKRHTLEDDIRFEGSLCIPGAENRADAMLAIVWGSGVQGVRARARWGCESEGKT